MVCDNCQSAVWMIASQLDMKEDNVWKVITKDLGLWKVCQNWCQDFWMVIRRSTACRYVRTSLNIFKLNQTSLSSLVMRYWFLSTTWKTNCQSSKWKSPTLPRPKKAKNIKIILIMFFYVRGRGMGIIHCKFLPLGQMINQQGYPAVFALLRAQEEMSCGWTNSWLISLFNGISTFVGYLMPKPFS